ncbi:MAG: lipid-A-disaccharide synthase [Bdellovibrionales bacterium]|nr:lipid-A-disaccharide synthase [Bdellovibrionales bacterium]
MSDDSVMIVAAEASSAAFAVRLLESWKKTRPNIRVFGVGSSEMESLGFERLGKSEEMAVVGAAEIITHYKHLKAVFNRLVEEAAKRRPRVVVVMDYPEFNLMLSKKLHRLGIPVVYYISPQIWAWRQGRVKTIQRYCKKVFLLFPFEKKFYDRHQVTSEFVGHPVLDELDPTLFDEARRLENRRRCGIEDKDIVLGLMPGSRRLELKQHFAIQLEVARILMKKHSQMKLLILCAPSFSREDLLPYLEDFGFPYIIQKDDPLRMINLTDLVLVASGTATLMVGLLRKPMVIMYKMKWLTGWIARILVRGTKFFGLVNLILDREVVPERWQAQASPSILAHELDRYLVDPGYRQQVIQDLSKLPQYLGEKGATDRVVKSLEEFFVEKQPESKS